MLKKWRGKGHHLIYSSWETCVLDEHGNNTNPFFGLSPLIYFFFNLFLLFHCFLDKDLWTPPLSPPGVKKYENSEKFWKNQGTSGGPLGTHLNNFRALEAP